MNRFGIALLGASLAVSVAFAAQGDGQPGRGKGHRGGGERGEMGMRLPKNLNITEDQKARIKALHEQFKTQNASALAEIKTLREKMREYAKNQDKENAKATRDQIKAKMEALKPVREQLHAQMLAILTPEQRAELEKKKADCKGKMDKRRGEWKEKRGKRGAEEGTTNNGGSTLK